jgi:hypothetical protein
MYANIQIPSNLALDPFLAGLVVKLALDMPAFTFTTKGMSKQDINYNTSKSSIQDRTIVPPEGVEFLRMVRVYKGTEHLGEISIDTRYAGSGPTEKVYCIKSWRIDNQRGNANTSRTSKLTGAVRIVKKTFIPMNSAEIIGKASAELTGAFAGTIRDLIRPIQHGTLVPNTIILQRYLYLLLRNEEIPEDMDKQIRGDMLSEKYEKAMAEALLAERMHSSHFATVVNYGNAFLYKRFKSDAPEYRSFDELPEKVQSAIAVLQLMEDAELVNDVGYRYNDRNFFILDDLFNVTE